MDDLLPTPVALVAALILAAVFVVAGVAKLRRPAATADDFAELGLPLAAPLAVIVPIAELACAGLLVLLPGWGGVAAFGLLAVFTANLAVVVRSGRVVNCACFGAASRHPVSVRHLVRNVGLAALALAAATIADPLWRLDLL
ncbi:MAG: MauE/DoxX family redox-associated membrane protein [Actinomycetota bacterium]